MDDYDLNPLKVAFAEDLSETYWCNIEYWDSTTDALFGYRDEKGDWQVRFSDKEDMSVSHDTPICIDGVRATHYLPRR